MEEKIIRCPVCSKIVALEKARKREKIEMVNGIAWDDIKISVGGWGSMRVLLRSFSGEVCNDCFDALKSKINELEEIIKNRKDSCHDQVHIYKTRKDRAEGDNVHDMQADELQSKRHQVPLLRLLSYFS